MVSGAGCGNVVCSAEEEAPSAGVVEGGEVAGSQVISGAVCSPAVVSSFDEDTPGCSAAGVVCGCSVEVGNMVEVVGDTSEKVVEVSGAEEVELS